MGLLDFAIGYLPSVTGTKKIELLRDRYAVLVREKHPLLRGHAQAHNMGALLANHAANTGGYTVAGQSAFWAPGGQLIVQAEGPGDCLVIAEENQGWQGRVMSA